MNGEKVNVGKYASSLRKYLFSEHLGILSQCYRHDSGDNFSYRDLMDPTSDEFYKKWVSLSEKNTKLFEEVKKIFFLVLARFCLNFLNKKCCRYHPYGMSFILVIKFISCI